MAVEVKYDDKLFELFISKEEIEEIVVRIAKEVDAHYSDIADEIMLISILDGSFVFMADLVRQIEHQVEIQFVKLKSYDNMLSRGEVAHILKLQHSMEDKHVLVVEDIIDTGLTLEIFIEELQKHNPKSIKTCTLLSKPEIHNDIVATDFVGREIGPEFVIGYGLDIDGKARQLPAIYRLKV